MQAFSFVVRFLNEGIKLFRPKIRKEFTTTTMPQQLPEKLDLKALDLHHDYIK